MPYTSSKDNDTGETREILFTDGTSQIQRISPETGTRTYENYDAEGNPIGSDYLEGGDLFW